VGWPPAWESVNWSKGSVVGYLLDSNDMSIEAVKIHYQETTSGSRMRRLSVCYSDL
jgi:hypothetical protein